MESKNDARDRKKAQFSEGPKKKSRATPVLVVIVLALVAVAGYMIYNGSSQNPTATAVTSSPTGSSPGQTATQSRDIRISLSDLSGTAKFFDYKTADNKSMRFFIIKSSDGVYRAALDACDTCYHAKKGYHQEGDDMVCNNCGLHFHSAQINEVHGGCNPVGLPRTIDGSQLVIKSSELDSRASYF